VARKKDMPLWWREEPNWRMEAWMALKMWFAFLRGSIAVAVVARSAIAGSFMVV
jgi:hypothetical protein